MSKARPHAHIYEKWMRGIAKAVPNAEERCALLEYIIQYQIANIYDAAEAPNPSTLSPAAALAYAMIEGDLDELCEARTIRVNVNRENGRNNTQPTPTDPNGSHSTPTIQSNTIQYNTKQNQKTRTLARDALFKAFNEFELGFALLRKGYIVKAAALHARYDRAAAARNPVAYAAKGLNEADDKAALNCAANYLEATGCKDTRSLELYGADLYKDGGVVVLRIRCAAAARDAIGITGQDKARDYLKTIGATVVEFVCNG